MSRITPTTSPRNYGLAGFAALDAWVLETTNPQLRDALLDLRASCSDLSRSPAQALASFLKLRPSLSASSYLSQHRLRRDFEQRISLEITTPDACWTQPLSLKWNTLEQIFSEPRREVFEKGVFDWNCIRVRLVTKLTLTHGQDTL